MIRQTPSPTEQHDAHVRDWRCARAQAFLVRELYYQLDRMMNAPVT